MSEYKEIPDKLKDYEHFANYLTIHQWECEIFPPEYSSLDSDNKNDELAGRPDPFGSYDTSHLIDLHPTANADLETEHSTLIAACFAQHNYISMYVESKDVFLKSFEICVYYKDIADLINFLSVISSYQEVISTENYLEFIAGLLDFKLKVVWLSGQALLEEVTYQNLSEGHPDLQMI